MLIVSFLERTTLKRMYIPLQEDLVNCGAICLLTLSKLVSGCDVSINVDCCDVRFAVLMKS